MVAKTEVRKYQWPIFWHSSECGRLKCEIEEDKDGSYHYSVWVKRPKEGNHDGNHRVIQGVDIDAEFDDFL